MILTDDEHEVCFLHIPRTGGRYIANLLVDNGYDYAKGFPGSGYRTIYFQGKELLHLNLQEETALARLCDRELPQRRFTVIRNPVDKFISFSNVYYSFVQPIGIDWKQLEDYELFSSTMDKFGYLRKTNDDTHLLTMGIRTLNNNAYIDQREFIDDSVSVWKYEDGLGQEFVDWLNNDVKLNVKLTDSTYNKRSFDNHKRNFSDKFIQVLHRYYHDELQHFGYL